MDAYGHDAIITVRSQRGFDGMDKSIRDAARVGKRDILIKIKCGKYFFNEEHLTLKGLPEGVSVTLKGKHVKIYSGGKDVKVDDTTKSLNVYYQHRERKIVDNWSKVQQCNQLIEVVDSTAKICSLQLVDDDEVAKGDVIQISQWYLTYKYEIIDIRDGYAYFIANNLKRCDGGKSWNVNYDYVYGKEMPRYRIWHAINTKKNVCEGNAMHFVSLQNVNIRNLTIEGLTFCGNTYLSSGALIQVNGVKADAMNIRSCIFRDCHSTCISLGHTANVTVSDCKFYDNMTTAIYSGGSCENVHITDCLFENNSCGWNNTFCINIKGKNFLIARNLFRDFAYGAIGIGEHYGDKKVWVSGIIEQNEIYYSSEYYSNYKKHTLMDSGAIYFWTQNDDVTIRNNFIHDYIGMKDNRGIFCDDGASNYTITGNTILRVANCYCIDSRRIKDQNPGKYKNNVNITITDNIVDGRIRFEGREEEGNLCVYGRNTVKMVINGKAPEMKISNVVLLD